MVSLNDAINFTNYMAPVGRMNNITERTRKHAVVAWFTSTYQPSIYLEMSNITKTICNDSNGASSEYK
jgi:hypothetical protein